VPSHRSQFAVRVSIFRRKRTPQLSRLFPMTGMTKQARRQECENTLALGLVRVLNLPVGKVRQQTSGEMLCAGGRSLELGLSPLTLHDEAEASVCPDTLNGMELRESASAPLAWATIGPIPCLSPPLFLLSTEFSRPNLMFTRFAVLDTLHAALHARRDTLQVCQCG
jgi:hypothetical protein